jgi:hypothetical protein
MMCGLCSARPCHKLLPGPCCLGINDDLGCVRCRILLDVQKVTHCWLVVELIRQALGRVFVLLYLHCLLCMHALVHLPGMLDGVLVPR